MFRSRERNPWGRLAMWTAIWSALVYVMLQMIGVGFFFLPFFFFWIPGRRRRAPSPARYAAFITAGLALAYYGYANLDEPASDLPESLIAVGLALAIATVMFYGRRLRAYRAERDRFGNGDDRGLRTFLDAFASRAPRSNRRDDLAAGRGPGI